MKFLYLLLVLIITITSTKAGGERRDYVQLKTDTSYFVEKINYYSAKYADHRKLYTYNEQGRYLTVVTEYFKNDVWIKSDSVYYTRNNDGNILTYNWFWFVDNQWNKAWLGTNKYDSKGNLTEYIQTKWANDRWTNYERETYSYNDKDSVLVETQQQWDGSGWETYYRLTQEYDETGNRIKRIYENKKSYVLENDYMYEFSFDDNGFRTSYTHYVWNGDWTLFRKGLYQYNETGLWIATYVDRYNNGKWEPEIKATFEHNSNGDRINMQQYSWIDNDWKIMYLWTYTYNENFDLLSTVYQKDNNDEMMYDYRFIYNYDEKFNLLSGEYNIWVAGHWIQEDYFFTVDDAMGNTAYFSGCRFEVIYKLVTNVNESKEQPLSLICSPNPTIGPISIDYVLEKNENVSLSLFNSQGLEILKLIDEHYQSCGKKRIDENFDKLPSGSYFLNIRTNDKNETHKVIINK